MSVESFSQAAQERSIQAKVLLVSGLASAALFGAAQNPDDVEAYGRGKSSVQADGNMLSQQLTFNPKTGKAVCTVEQQTGQEFTHGPLVLARIEQWNYGAKEWEDNQFFKQPFEQGPEQEDPLLAKTVLRTVYNAKRLRRADAVAPTRIACYGADDRITLPLIYKNPR